MKKWGTSWRRHVIWYIYRDTFGKTCLLKSSGVAPSEILSPLNSSDDENLTICGHLILWLAGRVGRGREYNKLILFVWCRCWSCPNNFMHFNFRVGTRNKLIIVSSSPSSPNTSQDVEIEKVCHHLHPHRAEKVHQRLLLKAWPEGMDKKCCYFRLITSCKNLQLVLF